MPIKVWYAFKFLKYSRHNETCTTITKFKKNLLVVKKLIFNYFIANSIYYINKPN